MATQHVPLPVLQTVTPAEARAIAKEAYIYGFPMVDSYRIQHAYFVDRSNPEFKAPWNHIRNIPRVYTPGDKAIQTPNSDTPYSFLGADLRSEPLVLTMPAMEKGRYFSVQFIDLYTFNFAYIGSRTTGNDGGSFLLAGPRWKGEIPAGVRAVVRSETEFVFVFYRTQLLNAADLDNVRWLQASYQVETLSEFLGKPAPPAAPRVDFVKPLTPAQERTSLEFFNILNFVLQFCPTHPSERELMARFDKLGIGAGRRFDIQAHYPEVRAAIEEGMANAWRAYDIMEKQMAAGERTSGDLFGSRAYLKNSYLSRMVGAVDGIYGNSREEAIYPGYLIDSAGRRLDGLNRYTLRFAPGQLPPVHAFWSLTMYELPSRLLVANSLNRYLINSAMLPRLKRDADGGLTLYIQNEPPGQERESNWLPAPKGPFFMGLRLYWPKLEAIDNTWVAPPLERPAQEESSKNGLAPSSSPA